MKKKRVLVTGASGFLGQAVQQRLHAAGHAVIGLDIRPSANPGGFEHVIDDLSGEARLGRILDRHRPDAILHAGGVSGPMVMADDPLATLRINVGGTLNLLGAALGAEVGTFIHCSSIAAVGSYWQPLPIEPGQPMRPESPYGCSKAACEFLFQGLHGRVPMDLAVLRFSTVYGPGRQTADITHTIVEAGLSGRPARIPAIGRWPYVYIDDAADAAVAALLSTTRRQLVYYVTHPEVVSPQDIAAAAAAELGLSTIPLETDGPLTERGSVETAAPERDFGFAARIGHREGVRRLVEARRGRS